MAMVSVEQLRLNVAELQNMYTTEPIRNRFGFAVTHTDLLGRQNVCIILEENHLEKLADLNKSEQNATQARSAAWTEFLNNHEPEKIRFQDNPDFIQNCSERFSCSICRIALPNFDHYLLHFFGNLHTQRKRRAATKANRLDMCSWDKLIQLLCEAKMKLSEVRFDNWTMPDNQYKVRMQIGPYKFQAVGSDFKSMRLRVIDKALDFAESNFCANAGCRIVRFPYLPEIERAPVVIDNIKSTYLYSLPKPLNDDPSLPVETIVMSLIDYAACSVAAEEKRRYGKYLMDVFKRAHLSRKAAFCDICDARLPEGLCAAHVTSLRHFRSASELLPMRRCVEMSLIRGIPVAEVEGYEQINEPFKKLQEAYRAPFELIDLLKRYCYYYCAFCKFPIRHETELERHVLTQNHYKNMEANKANRDENFKNRQLMKDFIRQMLIPAEYKTEYTSIDQLPESVRNELPLSDYSDEVLERSIESALNDPEALIERAQARFLTNSIGDNRQGSRRRKRPYTGRNRGDAKRSRRRRPAYDVSPKIGRPQASDSPSQAVNDDKSPRVEDETRRRRTVVPSYNRPAALRQPPSPLMHSLASADRRYYGRANVIDRIRDRVALYDESFGYGGNQWSPSMDHRENRQWSRPSGRDEYSMPPPQMAYYTMPPYPAGSMPANSMYQYNTPVNRHYYYRNEQRM